MMEDMTFLFSALAYLCGVTCLCVCLAHEKREKNNAKAELRQAGSSAPIQLSTPLIGFGIIAVTVSFLFLPAGSLPAYAGCPFPITIWLALFCFGHFAATQPWTRLSTDRSRSPLSILASAAAPMLFLTVLYGAHSLYVWKHGFPADLWRMESIIALPALDTAAPMQTAGFVIMTAASILYCFTSNPLERDSGGSALQAHLLTCLRLARCAFVIALFFPVPAARCSSLPTVLAVAADFVLYWILVSGLAAAPMSHRPILRWGAVIALLTGSLLWIS